MKRGILAILIALLWAVPVLAGTPAPEIAIMVMIDGVSLDQLAECDVPQFQRLMKAAALGLMNNRTDGSPTFENNAVTIGAGARGVGHECARYGFNADEQTDGEPAKRVFGRNTGLAVPETAVVQTKLARVQSLNSVQRYQVVPGLLGQLLQDAGVAVAVFGNSDARELSSRSATAIAMNSQGWVASGDVGKRTLVNDPGRPYGVRTNYDYLLESVKRRVKGRAFVVLELGDSGRAEACRAELLPPRHEHLKRLALADCGRFIAILDRHLKRHAERYLLMVVVPSQGSAAYDKGDRLTPILLTGTGVRPGLLSSSTTRRRGLVTNLDLAPTILVFFDVEKDPRMIGTPVKIRAHSNHLGSLHTMNGQITATFTARRPVLTGYVYFVTLSVVLTILSLVLYGRPLKPIPAISRSACLEPLLTALMIVPVSLLVAPALGIHRTAPSAAFAAVSALAAACVLNRSIRDLRLVFAMIGTAAAAMLCADLLAGAPLMKKSILGYDPIGGSRFYGIGNEYGGVLIGATLLGIYSLFDYLYQIHWKQLILAGLVCGAIALLIGLPKYGTNFGGTLAALVGFGFAVMKAREGMPWRRGLLICGVCIAVLLVAMLAANLMLEPAKQSHIGRAFAQARQGSPEVLVDTAIRKWSMNLRLVRYSIWTHVLVSLIGGLAILFYRPVGIVRHTLRKHPLMNAGFTGILVSMAVAMLTNDSGVVMAATSLLYLTVPLMFMVKTEMDALPAASEHEVSPVRSRQG